jgi:hypothetical protein
MPCGGDAGVYTLGLVAACCAVAVSCFILWQLMLDPRVASPFVFLLRLMETLAILPQTSIDWTPAVRTVFAALSVVNFNTEMFRFECVFGPPKPIQQQWQQQLSRSQLSWSSLQHGRSSVASLKDGP